MTQEHVLQMFLSVTHQMMSKNLLGFILTRLKLLTKYSRYGCKASLKFRGCLYHKNAFTLSTNNCVISKHFLTICVPHRLWSCGLRYVAFRSWPCRGRNSDLLVLTKPFCRGRCPHICERCFSMAEQGQKRRGSYSQADTSTSHCPHMANNSFSKNYTLVKIMLTL